MIKVTCGILQRGDKYFVAKRPEGKYMAGFWEFPGGKVEDDEFENECLHREWDEELGVKVIILKEFMPVTYDYPKFKIELYPYMVESLDFNFDIREHEDWGFFTKDELLKMDMAPADRIIVEKYL